MLVATCAWADDATDRAAIERVTAAVNSHSATLADVFTADAPENERSILSAEGQEPWSEVTSRLITIRSIRFLSPQIALVQSTATQYGSVTVMQSTPMLLVMKKDGQQWRIACVFALQDLAGAAKPSPGH